MDEIQDFRLLIARCQAGIHFPEQPTPVCTVFLLVGPSSERNFHLRALSAVAQILQDASFEDKWRLAGITEKLRSIVLQADRRRFEEAAFAAE